MASNLPTADVLFTLGSRTIPAPQLPASSNNGSQGLNRTNPLTDSLSNRQHFTSLKQVKGKVKVMLRATVQSASRLGIKHPSGAYDQKFITVRQLQASWFGALSLTRGRVCRLPDSVNSNTSLVEFTCYKLLNVCIYNICKTSVSPGLVQQIMPYH
jgi:hypothetical protein